MKLLRPVLLIAVLFLIPAAARPVDPFIACSACSCRVQCGQPCRVGNGTFSACGLSGYWCQGMPVCYG
jgi:hypothetical protein